MLIFFLLTLVQTAKDWEVTFPKQCQIDELWELKIVATEVQNPYDPEEWSLEASFTYLDTKINCLGFYYRPYTYNEKRSTWERSKESYFAVRFAPPLSGQWKCQLVLKQKSKPVCEKEVTFTVLAGAKKERILICENGSYLKKESGEAFFPIGFNLAWYKNSAVEDYAKWFKSLSEAGGNYARIWLASWSFAPEWNDTGLGNYDKRQSRLAALDWLVEEAGKYGIYLQLCFLNHGQFSTKVDPEWNANPYNSVNGGPIEKPEHFYDNELAQMYWHRKVKYLIARYSYSPQIMIWELWNEVNWTDGLGKVYVLKPWLEKQAKLIKEIDPYQRPVSLSFQGQEAEADVIWQAKGIDIVQLHQYNEKNWSQYFQRQIRSWQRFQKPVLAAEFGLDIDLSKTDLKATHVIQGIWSSTMAGAAGCAHLWWWDNYIDSFNLWSVLTPLREFVSNFNFQKPDTHLAELSFEYKPYSDFELLPLGNNDTEITKVYLNEDGFVIKQLPGSIIEGCSEYFPKGQAVLIEFNATNEGVLNIYFDAVAKKGVEVSIILNDVEVFQKKIAGSGGNFWAVSDCSLGTIKISYPQGNNIIKIANKEGWISWEKMVFTNLQKPKNDNIAYCFGIANKTQALIWAQHPRGDWSEIKAGLTENTAPSIWHLQGLENGLYDVELWDPYAGLPVSKETLDITQGFLRLELNPADRDQAFCILKKN